MVRGDRAMLKVETGAIGFALHDLTSTGLDPTYVLLDQQTTMIAILLIWVNVQHKACG